MSITPFAYQEDCLSCLQKHRSKGERRGNVVMATGLGKTYTVAFEVQRYLRQFGGRVLYLCHMTDILYQAHRDFKTIMGDEHTYGFFHGSEKNLHEVDCLFSSFGTMNNWLDLFNPEEFDYIVVDESHHSKAETFSKPLEYFKPKFLLGVTATPDRMDNKDIREIFGPPIFNLPLEKALALGYLTPVDYRILTDEIQLEGALATPERRWSIHALNRLIFVPKRDEEITRIVYEHVNKVENPKMIVFCSSIAHCNHLMSFMPDSLAIHSKIPQKERDIRLEMFRQDLLNTIITVDCFNEGIDIPRANVIVFLRSTASRTILLQQLGRGLRKCEGKDKVLVLDFVGNLERIKTIQNIYKEVQDLSARSQHGDWKTSDEFKPITVELGAVSFEEKQIPFQDLLMRVLPQEFYGTWQDASIAALKLGINDSVTYKKKYRADKRLPSNPHAVYADWPGWHIFLDMFYKTLAEAEIAVGKLGIQGHAEYLERYKEDPKLPSSPSTYYADWEGWGPFCGTGEKRKTSKDFYPTLAEASAAAQKLGFKSMPEYQKGYRVDSRLPSNPNYTYENEWKGIYHFLGLIEIEPYNTLEEISESCKRLGIKSQSEYTDQYKKDPRLPSTSTVALMEGFPGWRKFLGIRTKYGSLAQATEAVRKLRIQSVGEYEDRYKEDPLLPASPHQSYSSDWKSWPSFFGKE